MGFIRSVTPDSGEDSGKARYRAFWREPSGRQRSKTFETKRQASHHIAEMEAAKARGTYVSPHAGRTLFRDHAAKWMAARRTEMTTSSRDESLMRNHVIPQWGSWPVAKIDEMSVQSWVTGLCGQRSNETVSKCLQLTAGVLKSAVSNRLIAANPCEGVTLSARQEHDTDDRVLERDEVLTKLVPSIPEKHRALVALAAGTGLRWGELVGLRQDAMDLSARRLKVMRTVIEVNGNTSFKAYPKSAAAKRTVPIPRWAAMPLAAHLDEVPRGDHGLIFPNELGHPLRRSLFRQRIWRPALVRAGLLGSVGTSGDGFEARWTDKQEHEHAVTFKTYAKAVRQVADRQAFGFRFHDLRHSYGTWLADDGVPPNKLQKVMGHEKVTTTLKLYVRKTDDPTRILQALDDEDDGDDGATGVLAAL